MKFKKNIFDKFGDFPENMTPFFGTSGLLYTIWHKLFFNKKNRFRVSIFPPRFPFSYTDYNYKGGAGNKDIAFCRQ